MTPEEIAADRTIIAAMTPPPMGADGALQALSDLAAASNGWSRTLDALEAAQVEVERLRARHTEMNRRLTKAEAHVETTIEDCRRQGVSLGRGLANAGYESMRVRAERAVVEANELRERVADLEGQLAMRGTP